MDLQWILVELQHEHWSRKGKRGEEKDRMEYLQQILNYKKSNYLGDQNCRHVSRVKIP